MRNRARWAHLAVLFLAGCDCYQAHDGDDDDVVGGDAGVDADGGAVDCDDEDGDGYGAGPDCVGPDCDDRDDAVHVDCPDCDPGMTDACYGGPDGTAEVGLCRRGERACVEGAWGECMGDVLPIDEVCDDVDQDCNGVVDDGFGTCGDCDPTCRMVCAGVGCLVPLSDGDGIEPTLDGGIRVVDGARDRARHVLWIADALLGTVFQIDTQTFDVVGTYQIGSARIDIPDLRVATVDPCGNAFVSSQESPPSTLSRIDAEDCFDRNGDGTIETSTGRDDLLTAGEDECVRWTVPLDTWLVVSGAYGPDGRLWMGLPRHDGGASQIGEYDPDSGELIQVLPVTPEPYALVGDADGLWIAGPGGESQQGLSHVAADGTGEVVHSDQRLNAIAVRQDGTLIVGMPVSTYDPLTGSLVRVDDEDATDVLTVDGLGQTWALGPRDRANQEIRRWDPGFGHLERFPLEQRPIFAIADLDMQVWTMGEEIEVYDAATGDHIASVTNGTPLCSAGCTTSGPYGDPAGTRLHATMPHLIEHGEVRAAFDVSCAADERASARMLTLDAEAGLDLVVETRSAPADRLVTASWQRLAEGDGVVGELVVPVVPGAGQVFVEVRVRFRGTQGGTLNRIRLQWHCTPADE